MADAQVTYPGRMAVVGMFDGVHTGHRHLLDELKREASARGLEPLVVTFSNHPLELVRPGSAPALLTSAEEKVSLIRAAGIGRVVCVPFDDALRHTTAGDFLLRLRREHGMRALLLGFNNRFGYDAPSDFEAYRGLGESLGVEIVCATCKVADADGTVPSSTAVREALASGRMEDAAVLLGRDYELEGEVVHGRQLGRTIGFPTANIVPEAGRAVPGPGVYAACAAVDGGKYRAMVNIGRRPTVDRVGAPIRIEAHLIGLPEGTDLYGRVVRLRFGRMLRGERKFESVEALAAQLRADREAVMGREVKG